MGFWRSKELTFIMTNRCNIDCVYCYPGNYRYGDLQLEIEFARRGIIDFLVRERLGPLDRVRYFGIGEPTVEFGLMRKINDFIIRHVVKEKDKPITGEIQTNGVFSEDIAHWIGENLDTICISCDGPPSIQNRQRPFPDKRPTSTVIERNVKILRGYPIDVGMRSTITQLSLSVASMIEIVDYAKEAGFEYLYLHPLIPIQGPDIVRTDNRPYEVDPMEFARNYLTAWEYAQKKNIFLGNHFTINFDEKSPIYCRSCLPTPQLTLDGYVSCCDEALYGSQKYGGGRFRDLIIGKYETEADCITLFEDRIQNIRTRRNVHNMDICRDCEIAENCAGGCLGEALFSTGDPFKKLSDSFCEAMKFLAAHLPRNQGLFSYRHP